MINKYVTTLRGLLYKSWFIGLLLVAVTQPDCLITTRIGIEFFNFVNIAAAAILLVDMVMTRPFRINYGLIVIFLVQLALVVSTLMNGGNISYTVKKLLMVSNIAALTAKNLENNSEKFIHLIYRLLYLGIVIHFLTLLLFPKGIFYSYYEHEGAPVAYLKHWFLSVGNNYVLFVLPACFLDRVRLHRQGAKTDLQSLLLYAMGLFGMFKSEALTSLAALVLFLAVALLSERRKLPIPNLESFTMAALALFCGLVLWKLPARLGTWLEIGEITFTGRTHAWNAALEWFKEQPVFGYGYEFEALLIEKLGGSNTATHCHNLYLDLLYRSGIVGLALFFGMVFQCACCLKRRKHSDMEQLTAVTLALYLCILFQMEAYFNLTLFYMIVVFGMEIRHWIHGKPEEEKTTVYVCETMYHAMLATLLLREGKNIIICTTHEEKNMENFRNLHVEAIPEATYVMRFRDPRKERLGLELLKDRYILWDLRRRHGFHSFELVNFAWSVNSIDRSSAWYYKNCTNAVFYEEGSMGSIGVPQSKRKLLMKRLLGIPVGYHSDKKLLGFYVQNPELYDVRFGAKLHAFRLRELMKNAPVGERIPELFLEKEKADRLKDVDGKTVVFTQPLSEDGFISEERKLEIYRIICERFDSEQTVLKVHPRDTSAYADVKAMVLRESFPSELFDVLGVRFHAAVGICTGAVNNINAEHRVNLNENFLKDTRFSREEMEERLERNGVLKNQ